MVNKHLADVVEGAGAGCWSQADWAAMTHLAAIQEHTGLQLPTADQLPPREWVLAGLAIGARVAQEAARRGCSIHDVIHDH